MALQVSLTSQLKNLREDIAKGLQDEKEGKVSSWDTQDIINRGKERMKMEEETIES